MEGLWLVISIVIVFCSSYFLINHSYKINQTKVDEQSLDEPDKAYITIFVWFLRSIRFLLLFYIAWFFIGVI